MSDKDFPAGMLVGLFLGAGIVFWSVNAQWKGKTVERGLATYCPEDGRWAWKGECAGDKP